MIEPDRPWRRSVSPARPAGPPVGPTPTPAPTNMGYLPPPPPGRFFGAVLRTSCDVCHRTAPVVRLDDDRVLCGLCVGGVPGKSQATPRPRPPAADPADDEVRDVLARWELREVRRKIDRCRTALGWAVGLAFLLHLLAVLL